MYPNAIGEIKESEGTKDPCSDLTEGRSSAQNPPSPLSG